MNREEIVKKFESVLEDGKIYTFMNPLNNNVYDAAFTKSEMLEELGKSKNSDESIIGTMSLLIANASLVEVNPVEGWNEE